jgi:hypothetical protein
MANARLGWSDDSLISPLEVLSESTTADSSDRYSDAPVRPVAWCEACEARRETRRTRWSPWGESIRAPHGRPRHFVRATPDRGNPGEPTAHITIGARCCPMAKMHFKARGDFVGITALDLVIRLDQLARGTEVMCFIKRYVFVGAVGCRHHFSLRSSAETGRSRSWSCFCSAAAGYLSSLAVSAALRASSGRESPRVRTAPRRSSRNSRL